MIDEKEKPKVNVEKTTKRVPRFTAAEIESRRQAHDEKVRRGGK